MTRKPGSLRWVFGLLVLLGLVGFFLALYRVAAPQLLLPQGNARWLVAPHLIGLAADPPRQRTAQFRARTTLAQVPPVAWAELRSLGQAELLINGRSVARSQPQPGRIESASLDLVPYLQPGDNLITVLVQHSLGPAAIRLGCDGVPMIDWQVSVDGLNWRTASAATERADAAGVRPASMRQWNAPEQLLAHADVALLLAALGAGLALALRHAAPSPARAGQLLRAWQWLLLLGLALLHGWNFKRLPLTLGMDFAGHVDYVNYILRWHELPLADQGWQMFQPPLAYLSAALVATLRASVAPDWPALALLRGLTLLCSLATAWLACRICVRAFARPATAAAAMVLAVFLPVSVYMAPAFSNEPFVALFGTLLVWESVRLLKGDPLTYWNLLRMGLWLGLGLLSKPTVVLLLPSVLLVLAWRAGRASSGFNWVASGRAVLAVIGLGVLMAAAWYVRNVQHFGRPFVGGWEAGRGLDWWQYPGFRVPEHGLRFGESLLRPLYSGLDSFWDSVYSTLWLDGMLSGQIHLDYGPPWQHGFMVSLALLSLPVLAAMLWGALRGMVWPKNDSQRALAWFAVTNFGILLLAMAGVYGQVPAYSAGKGSYLLCALGCFPILLGLGLDGCMQRTRARVAVSAFLALWLGFVLLAFTVR